MGHKRNDPWFEILTLLGNSTALQAGALPNSQPPGPECAADGKLYVGSLNVKPQREPSDVLFRCLFRSPGKTAEWMATAQIN
jgi:hypothetical protein